MPIELTDRQRRLIDAALILGVVALAFIVITDAAVTLGFFGDILLQFFLAWLLSFALLPLISGVQRLVPKVGHAGSVMVVYLTIVGALFALLIQASANLASSINQLISDAPNLQESLIGLLTGIQAWLASLGFSVDLVGQAPDIIANLSDWAGQLIGPIQSVAVASIGVIGNLLILVILSIYIAMDREQITAFLYRLVPPGMTGTARFLGASVSKSFGGFLRTQLIMGVAFGLITGLTNLVFGLPYSAVTTFSAGILHAIPFFGPFISWAPPVAAAVLAQQGAVVPVVIVMAVGWFVTMNVLQPRLMSGAVGIHPIVVLGSVVVGSKIAGIPGAIFGIPIAAVLSAFFFYWFERSRTGASVADRATKRLQAREGHEVRRPREPLPGEDADVDEAAVARQEPRT